MEKRPQFSVMARANWRSIAVDSDVLAAKGMITVDEKKLLFWLSKEYFMGRGSIVDAGAFLGASALALAKGLIKNPRLLERINYIHSYDAFVAEEYTKEFIHDHLGRELNVGESFRHLFEIQIAECAKYITVHEGDFLQEHWHGSPIEILFIDICKNVSLNSHLMEEWFTSLIPGISVIVHQDYHHPALPWIHVSTEFLRDYLEILEERIDYSIVFGLKEKIPSPVLDKCVAYAFSTEEQIQLMDHAIERLRPQNRHVVELTRVVLLDSLGYREIAKNEFLKVVEQYRNIDEYAWPGHVAEVRQRLEAV